MNRLIVIMDMNIGFAKAGALYSPRTEALIQPIADFCEKMKRTGAKILALTDTHAPSDHEFTVFPPHCLSNSGEPEIVPELAPFCDWIVPKYTTGGFFELAEYQRTNPIFNWDDFEEIYIVGCCTDLCVNNFAIITQKFLESEYHFNRIRRVPQLILPLRLIETYDAIGHNADEINQFYQTQYLLNGFKTTYDEHA